MMSKNIRTYSESFKEEPFLATTMANAFAIYDDKENSILCDSCLVMSVQT